MGMDLGNKERRAPANRQRATRLRFRKRVAHLAGDEQRRRYGLQRCTELRHQNQRQLRA